MVFQSDQEIIDLIRKNPTPCKTIVSGRAAAKDLKALVNGDDFEELLERVEQKEDQEKVRIRKKYSRPTTDLFTRILRPLDNVYSATGTNKVYGLSDAVNKEFISTISKIRDNKSLESWLQTNWMQNYHTDPAGIIFLEYKKQGDNTEIYPTYKSSKSIRAYESKGQNLEWIIFEPIRSTIGSLTIFKWRVVDDLKDYIVIQTGDSYSVSGGDETFEHPFGQVPAVINSDMTCDDGDERLSPLYSIVPITKEYLRDQSIKTLYKFAHGFPIFWRYVAECRKCKGAGKDDKGSCSECDGQGFYRKKDVTDIVTLPLPKEGEQKISPDIAGFIAPDLLTWDQFNKELDILETYSTDTHWGSHIESGTNETATGRYIDIQPVINRLNKYADVAQWIEWQLSEWIANMFDLTKPKDETVVTINYGRNYIIESPDVLLKKYTDAKKENVSTVVLDRLLGEFITGKFKNNPMALEQNLKKLQIEPFVHYTVDEVQSIMGNESAQRKMLFAEWWSQVKDYTVEVALLTEAFDKYVETNTIIYEPGTTE